MRVKSVVYLGEYKLKLLFSDGKKKIIDLANIINNAKGILLPLKNIEYFKKVTLDDCQFTICWPNGADLCPDVLYEIGIEIPEQKKPSTPKIRRRKQTSNEKTEFKILARAKTKKISKKVKSK